MVVSLREQGMTNAQIAATLGMSPSGLRSLINDPDLSKQRARRERYRRPCPRCGTLMDGSGGRKTQPEICFSCSRQEAHDSRFYTPEVIVERIQQWARAHGAPPSASDWLRTVPEGGVAVSTVQREFGTWNAAIKAAGFDPCIQYRHDRETALQAIRDFVARNRRVPTVREFRAATAEHPSSSWYALMFGSWSEAVRQAGFRPNVPGGKRQKEAVPC